MNVPESPDSCPHRRRVIARTTIGEQAIEVYRCVLETSCTLSAALTRRDGSPMAACSSCTRQTEQATPDQIAAAQSRDRSQRSSECPHRGDGIRREKCTLCGSQAGPKGTLVQISTCALYGECAPVRYTAGQKPRACSTCEIPGTIPRQVK